MRHRSPRPVLDRLVPHVAPGMARRGVMLVGAVVGAVALGVAVAGPLADPAPGERSIAVKSPLSSASASWSVGTPLADREPRPSRGGKRGAPPASPVEREPGPTPAQQPSRTVEESPTRSSSPTTTRNPSPTGGDSATPEDGSAPDTSATTTTVEDGVWTVTSTADEAGSFECSLDGGEFKECDPTATFDDLDNGKHTLVIRAVDEAGNVDPSPTELVTNVTGSLSD